MDALIERIVNLLISNEVIEEQYKQIYLFGLHQGVFLLINFFSIIAIGIATNSLAFSLFFSFAYLAIRQYAGGYHTDTELRCYIFSSLMLISTITFRSAFFLNNVHQILLLLISILFIFFIGTVESENKRLDAKEREVYNTRLKYYLFVEVIIYIASTFSDYDNIIKVAITYGLIINVIMMSIGKIKIKYNNIHNNNNY